jgi:DNA polymerase-1
MGQVVVDMEYRGVPIDRDRCADVQRDFAGRAEKTHAELAFWAAGTGRDETPNWNSAPQLVDFFHEHLGMEPSPYQKKGKVRLDEGKRSTDDRALEWLAGEYPEHRTGINLIRRLRKEERFERYAATWLDLAVKHPDGTYRLHPSFGLSNDNDDRAGAVTGRLAVKNPALQQVPSRGEDAKLLRAIFCAPKGYRLISADFSQLEVVILAHICYRLFGATGLRDKLQPGQPDLHSLTAKYVFGEVLGDQRARVAPLADFKGPLKWLRDLIKAIRYGLNYGKGAYGFGTTLFDANGNPLGEEKAQTLIDGLLAFDPEIREYQNWVWDFIREFEGIISLLGRWCPLPDANSIKEWLRNRCWRRALNYPMQSGGQEVTAAAMIMIFFDVILRALGFFQIMQIHDEIVGLVPEDNAPKAVERVKWCMENALPLDAPLQVSAQHAERLSEAK